MVAVTFGERKRRYSKSDILDIISYEGITRDDFTYLCALSTYAMVVDNPNTGDGTLAGLKSISVAVIETDAYPTGYFFELGTEPIIVMNESSSILDYDFISELHPAHDWEIYLWLSCPWHVTSEPMGIHGEWYRREVYKDGMLPFDGKTLGWEDSAPKQDEETE